MREPEACPRCGAGKLKAWQELSEDEQEVVKRLPQSRGYSREDRQCIRWCPRCWYKVKDTETHA